MIFSLAPSKKQIKDAKENGKQYTMMPFAKEAFIFFVNVKNPINNLTREQLRGIYSGKITNWKEVGSPISETIMAFQRNEGSRSQSELQRFMGDTPIIGPQRDVLVGSMGRIINNAASIVMPMVRSGFHFVSIRWRCCTTTKSSYSTSTVLRRPVRIENRLYALFRRHRQSAVITCGRAEYESFERHRRQHFRGFRNRCVRGCRA